MRMIQKIAYLTLLLLPSFLVAQTKDLTYFIEQAKANSPLIFEKQNQNEAMAIEAKRLKAFYTQPEIALNAELLFAPIVSTDNNTTTFQWTTQDATNYYGYDLAVSDGGQYQALASFEQPLFGGKKLKTVNRSLDVNRKKNLNDIQLTEIDLERIVGYQYLRCLQSQKQITFYENLNHTLLREQQIMTKLVENAIYKPSDLQRLKIESETYKANLVHAQSNYKQQLLDLNIICGINDTTIIKLQNFRFSINSIHLDSSVFFERYRLDSLNLLITQQVSELKYQPQINLFADGGLNAVYMPGLNRFGISMGLKLSWVIFDGHQQDFMRQKTNILLQDITFKKQQFTTEQSLRLSKLWLQIKDIEKQLTIKQQQKLEYDKLMKIYKLELSQGSISVIDYINTMRDVAKLNQEIIMLDMQKQALINTYNYWNK